MNNKKIIFVVTEDWYFYSHRLPTAAAAQRLGLDVVLVTSVKEHAEVIEEKGIKVIDLQFERRSLNPFKALKQIFKLREIYKKEEPTIVHQIAMKPIVFGSIAAMMCKVPVTINAFAGLGYVFNAKTGLANILRALFLIIFRIILKRKDSYTLFQNKDDLNVFQKHDLINPSNVYLIRGSGVDITAYRSNGFKEPSPDVICVFAGRMIGIKGLPTLKEAFELLKTNNSHIKLWLCGLTDPENPGSWSSEQLNLWSKENPNVVWKGHCDMKEVWNEAHIAVQPSYGGEGVPKSLLEAAACKKAIVATDVPGCREVVVNGENGFLVSPYKAKELAEKIKTISDDVSLLEKMSENSRRIVEKDLSSEAVSKQVELMYKEVLDKVKT
jgi:glycosyltransferase involved in cell wall biosynthesis